MLAPMPDRPSQTLERELLEFAPDAVVGVDEQGEIQLANSRTEAVFGYERGELVGRPVEMLVPNGLRTGHVSITATATSWRPAPGRWVPASTSTPAARTAASSRARSPSPPLRPTRG